MVKYVLNENNQFWECFCCQRSEVGRLDGAVAFFSAQSANGPSTAIPADGRAKAGPEQHRDVVQDPVRRINK